MRLVSLPRKRAWLVLVRGNMRIVSSLDGSCGYGICWCGWCLIRREDREDGKPRGMVVMLDGATRAMSVLEVEGMMEVDLLDLSRNRHGPMDCLSVTHAWMDGWTAGNGAVTLR